MTAGWYNYDKDRGPIPTDEAPERVREAGELDVAGEGRFALYVEPPREGEEGQGRMWARRAPPQQRYGVCCSPPALLFGLSGESVTGAPAGSSGPWMPPRDAAPLLGLTEEALRERLRQAPDLGGYVDLGLAIGAKLGSHWRVRLK